jgi:hypothetical protein
MVTSQQCLEVKMKKLSTTIYDTTRTPLVNAVRAAMAKDIVEFPNVDYTDTAFLDFVAQIASTATLYKKSVPKLYKLKRLWFYSSTFVIHWACPVSRVVPAQMAYCCFIHGCYKTEVAVILVAWMIAHGRWMSENNLNDAADVTTKAWKDSESVIEKRKRRANELLKTRRQKMKRITFDIDERKVKLHEMILMELKKGRSTTRKLATDLGATDRAIACQLSRMTKKGLVKTIAWGLYEVA